MKDNIVICIPARYQSVRLPGKPLIEIAGKPLIIWAIESAKNIKASQLLVATDDMRIYDLVKSHGYEVSITDKNHKSGTDRLAEVAKKMQWTDDTIVINYQGDEPLTPVENIRLLIDSLVNNPDASIATLYQKINNYADLINPNNVKLVTDNNDFALYFSRSVIPFNKDVIENKNIPATTTYKHHIGLYAYRAHFLKQFSAFNNSYLEKSESLEQLRALSNGHKIIAKQAVKKMSHGIDTQEDLDKFEKLIKKLS